MLTQANPDLYIDVQNAASMLFRLERQGVEVGDRWIELADKAEARIGDFPSVFTVPHWMMALAAASAGKPPAAIQAMRDHCRSGQGLIGAFVRDCVLPISEAILAACRRRTRPRLRPDAAGARSKCIGSGGSHAQQDVLAQLFLDCAMAAGRKDDAR
jgi:hypothetical protein